MTRRWVLLMILIVALSGCTDKDSEQTTGPVNATPTPGQTTAKAFPISEPLTVYVNIRGMMFNPPEMNITKGTTVKWKNQDSGKYIVNVSGSRSPPINKTEYWSYTFNKTGTYEYGCDLHTFMPHGRITVI